MKEKSHLIEDGRMALCIQDLEPPAFYSCCLQVVLRYAHRTVAGEKAAD